MKLGKLIGISKSGLLGLTAMLPFALAAAQGAGQLAVAERIAGPDGGGWDYATIDATNHRLYLARDAGVMAMDLETHKITPVAVPGEGVHSIVAVGDSGLMLNTNGDRDSVTVFQAATSKVVGTVKVGKGADAAVFDPSTKLVAVMNHGGGSVALVDADRKAVVRTIKVGGELEFAAPSGDGQLFVNVASKHQIAVLDLNAGKVLRRIALPGCEDPSGLAYDAADGLVASVCGNGVTVIVHAATGVPAATLKTGEGSDALLLDSQRKLLYVPAAKPGTLTVINLAATVPAVVQTLKTGPGARLGALDAATGKLYLPTATMGPPVPPEPWPTVVPGTFGILVVAAR